MTSNLEKIKRLFRRVATSVENVADGAEPVSTPPPGATPEWDRETSTNARLEGAAEEPWGGNR